MVVVSWVPRCMYVAQATDDDALDTVESVEPFRRSHHNYIRTTGQARLPVIEPHGCAGTDFSRSSVHISGL